MQSVASCSRKTPLQTTQSYLVLASLRQRPDETPYGAPRLGSSSMRTFLPGPGEAVPLQPLAIHFEGVIRIEGSLLRWVFSHVISANLLIRGLASRHESTASSFLRTAHHLSSASLGLRPMARIRMMVTKRRNTSTIVGFLLSRASIGSLTRTVSVIRC